MFSELLTPTTAAATASIVAIVSLYVKSLRGGNKNDIEAETKIREIVSEHGIPSPEGDQISEEKMLNAVRDAMPEGYDDEITDYTLDGTYFSPNKEELDELRLLAGWIEYLPYRPERFDCEDFGFGFYVLSRFIGGVNSVGVVIDWESVHAYNVVVDSDGNAYWYEPMEDQFVEAGEDNHGLSDDILIIF